MYARIVHLFSSPVRFLCRHGSATICAWQPPGRRLPHDSSPGVPRDQSCLRRFCTSEPCLVGLWQKEGAPPLCSGVAARGRRSERTQGASPSLGVTPPRNFPIPNGWKDQDRRQGGDRG